MAVADFSPLSSPPTARGGGFLTVPDGSYSSDPAARIALLSEPGRDGVWQTVATPHLNGDGGPMYDLALHRWLPVAWSQVSPDGTHYAYVDLVLPPGVTPGNGPSFIYETRLHVVDPASGADRVVPAQSLPPAVGIVSYQADGIYLTAGCPEGCPADALKLWRLDPKSGALKKITDLQGYGWVVANGMAWAAVNQAPSGSAPSYEVVRVKLSDGTASNWLSVTPPCASSCRYPEAVAVDGGGNLLVEVWLGGNVSLERVGTPQREEELISVPAQSDGSPYFKGGINDGHGTWFGTQQGLFLYSTAGGLRKMTSSPAIPASECLTT